VWLQEGCKRVSDEHSQRRFLSVRIEADIVCIGGEPSHEGTSTATGKWDPVLQANMLLACTYW
jgi:hypothetical protein